MGGFSRLYEEEEYVPEAPRWHRFGNGHVRNRRRTKVPQDRPVQAGINYYGLVVMGAMAGPGDW